MLLTRSGFVKFGYGMSPSLLLLLLLLPLLNWLGLDATFLPRYTASCCFSISLTLVKKSLSSMLLNDKFLIAEVKSNKVKFSSFYNSVISNRVAETLELDPSEPYIEITLISKDSTFVAKKAKIFEEEKEVAEKAPIDGIKISNLNNNSNNQSKKITNDKFSYSIKVADFYYKKTANLMISRIKEKTSIKNIKLIELSKTNYRVLLGPFNDINSLKESYEKMNSLYFENLEILKNV